MTTREIFEKHVYLTSYCWEEHMRDVTKTVNMHNYRKANANSASGRLGVSLHKQSGKWRARLRVARQIVFEKLYKTVEEAEAAYLEAKRIHHADGCTI